MGWLGPLLSTSCGRMRTGQPHALRSCLCEGALTGNTITLQDKLLTRGLVLSTAMCDGAGSTYTSRLCGHMPGVSQT